MTDVAHLCHSRGSVHAVEAARENLILDLCTAGSYELSGQRGMLDLRTRFLQRRMSRGLARAPWPGYPHHPRLAWGCRRVQGPPRLARLLLTLHICRTLRRTTGIQPGSALRYQR